MATTTSIAGQNYSSFDAAFAGAVSTPAAGVYTALPPYGGPPREGSPEYEEILVTFLGVDGVGTKQGGFRGRDIDIDIVIADTSKANVETARNALLALLPTTSRVSVTVPGGTARPGCKLKRGSGKVEEWFTIGTAICCRLTLNIRQMSLS